MVIIEESRGEEMSRTHQVCDEFWLDDYTGNLPPIEKFLFLYFLTNPHANIAGAYKLRVPVIAAETGMDEAGVFRILKKFQDDKKVFYVEGYIVVKNRNKYNKQDNPSIQAGVRSLLRDVPQGVLDILNTPSVDGVDTVSTRCPQSDKIILNKIEYKTVIREPKIGFKAFVDQWNIIAAANNLAECRQLTKTRREKFNARVGEGLIKNIDKLWESIKNSDFLLGKKKQEGKHANWKISLDFILTNDTNWVKIIEGKYDGGPRLAPGCLDPEDDYEEGNLRLERGADGNAYYVVDNKDGHGFSQIVWKDYIPHKRGKPLLDIQKETYRRPNEQGTV